MHMSPEHNVLVKTHCKKAFTAQSKAVNAGELLTQGVN